MNKLRPEGYLIEQQDQPKVSPSKKHGPRNRAARGIIEGHEGVQGLTENISYGNIQRAVGDDLEET